MPFYLVSWGSKIASDNVGAVKKCPTWVIAASYVAHLIYIEDPKGKRPTLKGGTTLKLQPPSCRVGPNIVMSLVARKHATTRNSHYNHVSLRGNLSHTLIDIQRHKIALLGVLRIDRRSRSGTGGSQAMSAINGSDHVKTEDNIHFT